MRSGVALIECVFLGHEEAVKKLLDARCDVNQRGEFGGSALLLAACRNDWPIFKLLVSAGADVNVEDDFGNSPLSWAKKHNNQNMLALLLTLAQKEQKIESATKSLSQPRFT